MPRSSRDIPPMGRDTGFYRMSGVRLASAVPLPELPAASRGPVAHRIERGSGGRGPEPVDWFHRWLANGRPWLRLGRSASGYVLSFPRWADFVVSQDGREIRCHPGRGLPAGTLRHLLLDQVLPLAFSLRGELVLHGSAVHVPGLGGVAFIGRSGRGKSTLAATLAAAGCPLIADDMLVLRRQRGAVFAVPAYPGVRLWPQDARRHGAAGGRVAHYTPKRRVGAATLPVRTRPSPLAALFIMEPRARRGAMARVLPGSPGERLIDLVRFAYVMDVHDRRQLAHIFSELGAVVEAVPAMRLRVLDSRRDIGRIAAAVREAASRV